MCLAIPVRVTAILPDEMAEVNLNGVSMTVSVALLEEVAVGDYVIIHVGYALARIDSEEAERTLAMMRDAEIIANADTDLGDAA